MWVDARDTEFSPSSCKPEQAPSRCAGRGLLEKRGMEHLTYDLRLWLALGNGGERDLPFEFRE